MSNDFNGMSMSAFEILDVLGMHRRSGKIQIVCDSDAYGLHLFRGRVIFATSSLRSLRLGHLLLQSGSVQPTYLHDVLRGRRTVARDQALGSVLVRDGAITIADLAAGVEEQAVQVLTRVNALSGATFMHHGDEPIPLGIEIVPLETERLLQEAGRRHVESISAQVMQRLLPPREAPLTLNVHLALVSYMLTDAELLVALNVDRGSSSLGRLLSTLPLDQLTLHRTVISLLERGYLKAGETPLRFDL
jgi:hypothetical protein